MTSRRYQSQFFQFVTQQTQKLADKSATLLRHAKVTAIWTTQILLYPIYAAFQGTRAIGQQIGRTVEKAVFRLRMSREEIPVNSEKNLSGAPIQNVLTAVKRALVSGGNLPVLRERHPLVLIGRFLMRREETSIASNPYHIQGIACAVDTRKFVLILEDNVIFDILTPEQQQQIEHRIRLELARYWQWKRKLYLESAPLRLPEDRETLLPPIRVFRQLMAWVQTSPVAIAINLFQEAEIVEQPSELDWFVPSVPLSAWNPGTLIPKAPDPRNITSWFAQLPNLADLEALIWAAIHYFFGDRTRFSPAHEALSGTTSTNLGFRDLFRVSGREANATPETLILEGTATGFGETRSFSFTPSFKQKIREYLRKLSGVVVHQKRTVVWQETSIVISQTEEIITQTRSTLINIESIPTEIISTQTNTLTVEAPEPFEVETAFDWIETPVNQAEYVLTPWQKFLQSIDSGFLWIEQHIVLFWQWLTRGH